MQYSMTSVIRGFWNETSIDVFYIASSSSSISTVKGRNTGLAKITEPSSYCSLAHTHWN